MRNAILCRVRVNRGIVTDGWSFLNAALNLKRKEVKNAQNFLTLGQVQTTFTTFKI